MLDELKGMMVERLLHYEKTSKALPSRVIVYRDGVSEASVYPPGRPCWTLLMI